MKAILRGSRIIILLCIGGVAFAQNSAATEIGSKIFGTVRDDGGAPVTGAKLELYSFYRGRSNYAMGEYQIGRSDNDGSYVFAGLPPGKYSLAIESPVHLHKRAEITLDKPGDQLNLNLVLTRGRTIKGVVKDAASNPLPAVQIRADWVEDGDGSSRQATSDENGEFLLTGIPTGPFNITISATNRADYSLQDITAENDQVTIVLPPGRSVSGMIRGLEHVRGKEQINLEFRRSQGGYYSIPIRTDGNGGFKVTGIPLGTYEIEASAFGLISKKPSSVVVEADKDTAGVELVFEKPGILYGRVIDQGSGKPPQNCRVYASRSDGTSRVADIDVDGKYRFKELEPGGYALNTVYGEAFIRKENSGLRVTIAPGEEREINLEADGSQKLILKGKAVDDLGQGIAFVDIDFEYRNKGDKNSISTRPEAFMTDAAGVFQAIGDASQDVRFIAHKSGYPTVRSDVFTLQEGSEEQFTLVMPRGCRLAVAVTDDKGNPIRGAEVRIVLQKAEGGKDDSLAGVMMENDFFRYSYRCAKNVYTDEKGACAFEDLHWGPRLIEISHDKLGPEVVEVMLDAPATQKSIAVAMKPGLSVSSRVRFDDGSLPAKTGVQFFQPVGKRDMVSAGRTEADSAGRFSFSGLREAPIYLQIARYEKDDPLGTIYNLGIKSKSPSEFPPEVVVKIYKAK